MDRGTLLGRVQRVEGDVVCVALAVDDGNLVAMGFPGKRDERVYNQKKENKKNVAISPFAVPLRSKISTGMSFSRMRKISKDTYELFLVLVVRSTLAARKSPLGCHWSLHCTSFHFLF